MTRPTEQEHRIADNILAPVAGLLVAAAVGRYFDWPWYMNASVYLVLQAVFRACLDLAALRRRE